MPRKEARHGSRQAAVLEEGVPLRIPVVLDVEVKVERVSVGTGRPLNRVIDDQSTGT